MSELSTSIQYLSGVGPKRAELLQRELGLSTLGDLIHFYPFRYIDRSGLQRSAGTDSALASVQALVIRNAPTKLMKNLGYGKGYQYAHDTEEKITNMQCLPDSLLGKEYYCPTEQGVEARYKARLAEIKKWKCAHGAKV